MARRIRTIGLFKGVTIAAEESATSAVIDLRDINKNNSFSLSYAVTKGGAGEAGTATFSYLGCPVYDGTYVSPTGGTFGTSSGTAGKSDIISFSPPVMPFMKIVASMGTAGTCSLTAELSVL